MIILLDLDGPLADFDFGIDMKWNRLHPDKPINFSDRETFSFNNLYDKETVEEIVNIFFSDNFFENLPLVPGSQEALSTIQSMPNTEVFICSSPMFRNPSSYTSKRNWVYKNFGEDMARRLILAKDKTMIRGDILIDDKIHIKGTLEPTWQHILFTKKFNSGVANQKRIDWLSDWQQVLFS